MNAEFEPRIESLNELPEALGLALPGP